MAALGGSAGASWAAVGRECSTAARGRSLLAAGGFLTQCFLRGRRADVQRMYEFADRAGYDERLQVTSMQDNGRCRRRRRW